LRQTNCRFMAYRYTLAIMEQNPLLAPKRKSDCGTVGFCYAAAFARIWEPPKENGPPSLPISRSKNTRMSSHDSPIERHSQ
jgi:hypothetical protein